MNLRETPGQVPESNRHRKPWKDGSRATLVPLVDPHQKGQLAVGHFKVPARLAKVDPHTNEGLEFREIANKAIERWRLWKQMRGLEMTTKPKITGPFATPKATEKAEGDEELVYYAVTARFKSMYTRYVKLEDHLWDRELAQRYGVDLEADRTPWHEGDGTGETGWGDPMQMAEERRQRLGIKRKDYQFSPDLSMPLGMIDIPGARDILKRGRKS